MAGLAARFFRFVLTAVGLVLIGIGAAYVFGLPQVEDHSRRTFESQLSAVFGVDAEVQSVKFDPFRRAFILHDVSIGNPAAFRSEPAVTCERLLIKIEPESFLFGAPTLNRIHADGVFVDYRYKVGHGTNVARLLDSVDAYQKANAGRRGYRVELLETSEAKVRFSTNLIPLAGIGTRVVSVRLENVHENATLSSAEIAQIFLRSIAKEAVTLGGVFDPLFDAFRDAFTRDGERN